MRPLYLKLAATCLIATSAVLILRQSGSSDSGSGPQAASVPDSRLHRSGSPASPSVIFPHPQTAPCFRVPSPQDAATAARPSANNMPNPAPAPLSNTQGRAVQLAANVRLPAALMDLAETAVDNRISVSPAADAAKRDIATAFYQRLASDATAGPAWRQPSPADRPDAAAPEAGTADTGMIEPGPVADNASTLANESYRALFGDDAYNRQTMNSAIEVRLPVDSGGGDP
jgi:hypothetical protein